MTGPRLKSIVIENFRSLLGKIVVPLDAQVVLIHGTNGMGKTSVLSALELGLTGKIAHLANDDDSYKAYLTTLGTSSGSITLSTTAPKREGGNTDGSLRFSNQSFAPSPLLDPRNARFFAERCYLPQATLGRLLEIYDDQKTSSTSPLTLFVKELLGLDPLDALVDGLDPAFNVTRVRRIVPDYRRLEALKTSLQDQISRADRAFADAAAAAEERLTRLNKMLAEIVGNRTAVVVTEATHLPELRMGLRAAHDEDRQLTDLSGLRSELRGLLKRWEALPGEDASRDQAAKERADQGAAQAFAAWRSGKGAALDRALDAARAVFPDIPALDDGPEKARSEALRRAATEEARSASLLRTHGDAAELVKKLNAMAIIYLRKPMEACRSQSRQAGAEIEVTPQMVDAGVTRFADLDGAVSADFLVEQVYLAMAGAHQVESPGAAA